jgi:hypothetical protein
MKYLLSVVIFVLSALALKAQYEYVPGESAPPEKRAAVTVGVLQGGGALVGFDFEYLVAPRFGLQLGGGYIAYGAGFNYHLKPAVNSSFINFGYWHQGFGETFTQDIAGATFTFRARKLLSASLGMGFPLSKGPGWNSSVEQPPVMLLYSIGIYFPL